MASWQMHGVAALARLSYQRRYVTEDSGRATLAKSKGSPQPPASLHKTCSVTSPRVGGFDVHTVRHRGARHEAGTGPAIVYVHGGAYCKEIVAQHWGLIADLAEQTGCEVLVPLYGLAPQHTGLEARAFVLAVLEGLATQGRPAHLIGDSSGGGLALIAAQAALGDPTIRLTGATLIAPWLDLTMSNPGIDAVEPTDPWLARPGLRTIAASWADGTPLDDPRLSPIHGEVEGLPPIDVWVGTRDMTMPDCRLLHARLPVASRGTYREITGGIHVVPLLPVPEGRETRRELIADVGRRLAGARTA